MKPENVFIIEIGKEGIIRVNTKSKVIESLSILKEDILEINFPGISEENFSYLVLESIMKYYMNYEKTNKNLSDILKEIESEGFFSTLKPGLKINVTKI